MSKKLNSYIIEGQVVPGVTTITGVIAKNGLFFWYGKFGTAECERIKEESSRFGSAVHEIIEASLSGQEPALGAVQAQIMNNFKVAFKGYKTIANEVIIKNKEHMYGGTADCVAEKDGKLILIDWKTSKDIYPENYLQLAAYKEGLKNNYEGTSYKIDKCQIFHLNKESNSWQVLECETNGQFEYFLAARKLYEWTKKK